MTVCWNKDCSSQLSSWRFTFISFDKDFNRVKEPMRVEPGDIVG